MARDIGRRGWLGVIVTVVVLGGMAAVAIWVSLAGSTDPDYQIRTERPAVGEYFVNLWLDPHPPETGEVEISAQLTSIIGTAIQVDRLHIEVQSPDDSEPEELETEHSLDGPNDGDLYTADTTFDEAGTWLIVVTYSFGGDDVTDEFEIEVEG